MLRSLTTLACLSFMLTAGCTSRLAVPDMPAGCEAMAQRYGGEWESRACQQRIQQVARRLIGDDATGSVRWHVLDSDHIRAFAWADGRVLVTHGLTEIEDEALLAAAIAHECGHLIIEGRLPRPDTITNVSATRHDPMQMQEAEADRIGLALMHEAGYDTYAMQALLSKLIHDPTIGPTTKAALADRIARIDSSQP